MRGMSDPEPIFRMMLQSRGTGRYGFIIGRSDRPARAEPSLATFASLAEADEAGRQAMEIAVRQS
jgi:hypothetical protein